MEDRWSKAEQQDAGIFADVPGLERVGAHEGVTSGTGAVLLPLRPGNRPPVFFMPAPLAVGPVLVAYETLARHVPEGRIFLAFHPGESAPPGVDLVETALNLIRAEQPFGPYALIGECAGGILAWEIARRLTAAGERVEFLALLETPWPPNWRDRLSSRFQWLLPPGGDYLLRRAARHARALRSLPVTQWPGYLRGKSGAALATLRQARRRGVREALHRRAWYAKNVAAIRLEPWSGHLSFIQSGDPRHEHDADGWATLAGSIEVARVPGDHTTYLGDHVGEVATILGRWLGAPGIS